jgi:hypothetical protein
MSNQDRSHQKPNRANVLITKLLVAIVLRCFAPDPAVAQTQTQIATAPVLPQANQIAISKPGSQPPFAVQYEGHLTVREDRTGTEISTKRIKILTPSAIQLMSQQQMQFIEGMERLETVEAFTEKADGGRVPVIPANILTNDAASGLQATYVPDLKVRTIIFPDVAVGDTLVMTNKTEILQDEFPGQFSYFDYFPRSQSFSSVQVTVDAPTSFDLEVKTTGDTTTDKIETIGNVLRHTIKIVPEPYKPEEPGAVSPIDRDPGVMVSTFRSYEELGIAYGNAALPKTKPTSEITALADEITKNAVDHRAQALAIDAWVKKNIRYVALYLSVGRVVPHDAETILHNKFGDCKDKATLMAALLGAKGIASEATLINLGNSYTLPEPPTLISLNHVILYLPEFNLYDDPTASTMAFGVLAAEEYYKQVVRVSTAGASVALTPPMKPEDHTARANTTIKIAADGLVTGETREANTGVLGGGLRFAGEVVQQIGNETAAQRQLQSLNTPGTGHIELGNSSELLDPAVIERTFTLNSHFQPPGPDGIMAIPVGMPFTLRPGSFLFGARLSGRTDAFVCLAGTQSEDIEVTVDPALSLPIPQSGLNINNPFFTYSSSFWLKDRTLHIHRMFVSRAPRQVCLGEAEAKIAADMERVRRDVNGGYRFAPQGAAAAMKVITAVPVKRDFTPTAAVGQRRLLEFFYSINVDCSVTSFASIVTVEPPLHGKIIVERGTGNPNFSEDNPRAACNKSRVEGVGVWYEPTVGYTGSDHLVLDANYKEGVTLRRSYSVNIKAAEEAIIAPVNAQTQVSPPPIIAPSASKAQAVPSPIVELSKVAIANQPLRVAFLDELNPDCSIVGIPAVRVLEQPKSGKLNIEKGSGFSSFPTTNARFKCNNERSDGVVITYVPNSGYTGGDSLFLEIIYLDGTSTKRRVAIDVR